MHLFIILSLTGVVANPQVSQWGYMAQEEDTFATYAYTFGDIVIFSYGDSNQCEILDNAGTSVWSGMLHADEYHLQKGLPAGVYEIVGFKKFSVLTGDPFTTGLGTWYAVDENSRPISTKLLSVGPSTLGSPGNVPVLVVFAYEDNTHVVVRNVDTDNLIWEGDLDSAEYYVREGGSNPPIVYSVEATKPVSTMTGGGLGGMYIPAFNGAFTGWDFMTYQQRWMTSRRHDLQVVPWYDSTWVTITDLDNPSDTIWHEFFENRGEIKGTVVPMTGNGRALFIHSDKHVSLPQNPWTSFGPSSVGFFLMRGIDRDGLGIGEEFYLPLETSVTGSPSRLHVISFIDNTEIKVSRIPKEGGDETVIYEGTLDGGEYYRYTCPVGDASAHAIYHVTASDGVATIASCGDQGGSDFLPLWFAIHPAIAAYPSPQFRETYPGVPVSESYGGYYELDIENNGNVFDVINMFTTHSDPVNFTSVLTDEYGGSLPDADGDGNPDTDTLPRGARFFVLVDVIPSDTVPVGTIDTCFFRVVSSRDTTKCDTAFLITTIIPSSISEKPAALLPDFNFVFGQNVLYVSNPLEEELRLDFFDVLGRRVMSRTIQKSQASVDVSAFPKGVYFVSVRTGESWRFTRKVVVCR